MPKPKLLMGLSAVGVLLASTMLAGQQLVTVNEGLIRDVFGQNQGNASSIDSDLVEGSAYKDENGNLTEDGFKQMIADSYKFCEEAVEQGSILFKNAEVDGKPALPLAENERKVSLLGQGSNNLFMRSGAGGAAPNEKRVVSLDKAFESNGFKINHTVFDKYSKLSLSQMTTPSTNVEHSFSGFYTTDMQNSFQEYGDAAIITFVRIGTENTDPGAGQLDLKNDEKELLKLVKQHKDQGHFKKVIVLINSPLAMSVDWVDNEEYGIDACVYMGVPGYYGAGGIVHVLAGKDKEGKVINPSGHVATTFAASASSSAAYQNFGDRNVVVYKEGVYVGYKYYETRYADAVLGQGNATGSAGTYASKDKSKWDYADEMGYPFGFGLSYTTFSQKLLKVSYNKQTDQIEAEVEVTNSGDMDSKASVQLYVQEPYTDHDKENGLGKSAIQLMAYEKVDVAKGETKIVKLAFDRYFLTTYDYVDNRTYILEGGDYYFAVGNGSHEALNNILGEIAPSSALVDHEGKPYTANKDAVKKLAIKEDLTTYATSHYNEDVEVENQFDDADYNFLVEKNGNKVSKIVYLDRQNWQETWPTKTTTSPATNDDLNMSQYYKKAADCPSYNEGKGVEYDVKQDETIKFTEMTKVPLEGIVEDEDSRFYGEDGAEVWDMFIKQMNLDDLCISVSDNRGILDVAKVVKKGNSVAEGPEGLLSRFQFGDKRWATGFPTGPTYTATWDHAMQKKFGGFYGEECLYAGVACVNAPGTNINRTPYGSRASEYMSEDGLMNYYTIANVTSEARKKGLIMNVKHCFLNNQETGRQRVQTYANEQAIREIFLKPFEGALTKGHSLGIMTSYNRIGARYAATHEPLMMNVMRGEWAYKGQIIDDALTGSNTDQYSNGPAMLHCGTDIFCLDGGRGGQLKQWVTGNDDGQILKDLQRANKYVMYAISRSWMGGVTVTEEELEESSNPLWKTAVNAATVGTTVVTAGLVGAYAVFEVLDKSKKLRA